MIGPGRYDDLCTEIRLRTKAKAVIISVIGGERGNGFSMQSEHFVLVADLPAVLRSMADQIEKDVRNT